MSERGNYTQVDHLLRTLFAEMLDANCPSLE